MERATPLLSPVAGVEIVEWPAGEALRRSLARAGVPRLLVLDEHQAAPESLAPDEDWIRRPFDQADVGARARRILGTVRAHSTDVAWIDDHRVLHRGARTAVLTASEAVVAATLLDGAGHVVSRAQLEDRVWPGSAPPSGRAIDAIIYRLRRRCDDVGLLIRAERGRGFVLVDASS